MFLRNTLMLTYVVKLLFGPRWEVNTMTPVWLHMPQMNLLMHKMKVVVLTWRVYTMIPGANEPVQKCCPVPWEVNTMTPRWHRVWADGQLRLRLVRCNVGPFVVPRCAHANPQTVHCTYLCICKIFTTAQMRWPP